MVATATLHDDDRRRSPKQHNEDDRLGNLPDSILLNILDRLNIREAARTSVLSTGWRQLPAVLSQLRIFFWDFLPGGPSICHGDEIVQVNTAVVEATKSILGRRDSSRNTIQFLCMKFFLRDDDCISIGHSVGHTMATQKVEVAEFIVFTMRHVLHCNNDDLVNYGRQFMLFFDACPCAFGGLTRLHLENLRFGEFDISNVLNTCKRLKHLRLFNCDSGNYTKLQVEHSQLSELAIVDCSFERVVLHSLPKLTQMAFEGWISFEDPIKVGYVPLLEAVGLTNVCLSWHKMVVELSKFLGDISVLDLKLRFDWKNIWVQPEYLTKRLPHVFRQLRFLNLVGIAEGYDLTWTLFILEAAPNLKELYMTVWHHLCIMGTDSDDKGVDWESSASDFQHHNLATLTIFGFQFADYMVSYVRRVVRAAAKLQDVFLYDKLTCSKCHMNPPQPFGLSFTKEQQSSVKERITERINSSARIHFPTEIWANHRAKVKYP